MPEPGFSEEFSIELHSREVAEIGTHYYWVLRDLNKRRVVGEMHGWPADPISGELRFGKSSFTKKSILKFDEGHLGKTNEGLRIVVDTGFETDMKARWAEAQRIGRFLDKERIPYQPFGGEGRNSNSFARTFGGAMGYDVHTIIDPKTGEAVGIAPGNRDLFREFPNAPSSRFRTSQPKTSGTTADPRDIDPLTQRPREFSPRDIQRIIKKEDNEEFGNRRGALEDSDLLNSGGGSDRPNLSRGSSIVVLAERRRPQPVQEAENFKLTDRVSANNDVEPADARKTKRALIRLGFLEESEQGVNGFVDTALLEGIKDFQKQNGFHADGVVKPGGPTEGMIAVSLKRRGNRRGARAFAQGAIPPAGR